nr:hypothetical protein [Paramyrothecium sp.]
MLCEQCRAVFEQPTALQQERRQQGNWSARFDYVTTLSKLRQKANLCYSCRSIVFKLASQEQTPVSDDTLLAMGYGLWVPNGRENLARVTISVNVEKKKVVSQRLCLQRYQREAQCTSSSTGSDETLEFVKHCLHGCQTQHRTCSSHGGSDKWYPARLLEIQHDSIRLVEFAESSISKPYASLSHCWGGAEILNLTTKNIEHLKTAIDLHLLPQTFQDAIKVSRSLGISYIWIDSLCIIQDSTEDWKKESRTMLQVYRHALFNIAATDSKNSFSGLFRTRRPAVLASDVVNIDNGPLRGSYQLVNEHYFMEEVDGAPLNRRSWVTQERMLSRRIAHFASEHVIWDCAELTACETLPLGTKVWPDCEWGQRKIGCKQGHHSLMLAETIEQGLGQWARIVDTYSDCGLTFAGDKLVAIAGMAEYLRSLLKLEYCAGLWRSKLEIQLAWVVANTQGTGKPRNNLAPTWSWISINGGVKLQQVDAYKGYDVKLLANVTDVELDEKTDEGRGSRVTGYLRLRCTLNAVTIGGDALCPHLHGEGMEHARDLLLDSPDIIGADGLFFVPLFDLQASNSASDKYPAYSEIRGIIIHCMNRVSGIYERCGHALLSSNTSQNTNHFASSYENVKLPQGKEGFPCQDYNPASGHLITLV